MAEGVKSKSLLLENNTIFLGVNPLIFGRPDQIIQSSTGK